MNQKLKKEKVTESITQSIKISLNKNSTTKNLIELKDQHSGIK